ncbi:MAG: helix-turn-helix transcriptional regulator [Selenomonadaceae bacterium]|uniref:helix-turn-helix domain-containing protein n=2 Tax=Anaerovibrio slackiae TaxID=2652309 RepID=UPI00386E5E52|nr:helix-turn-helix transcriptional regulator [Selenomonadaceae bacterium]
MTRFRALRLKSGLSQTEFRRQYNERYNRSYTAAAISQIEHGKRMPELGALRDFADFYGVSVDYLLGQQDDDKLEEPAGRQISARLKNLVEQLPKENQAGMDDEVKENIGILRNLLHQSLILARRVEKDEKSWFRY